MHEWLVWPDLGALAPGLVFAAGAMTLAVLQCAIVACARWLARRRARAQVFPPDDPRRIWAELKELRADCATSAANLETAVAKLKDKTTAHLMERNSGAQELQRLQDALDQRATLIDALERQVAELELLRTRHALELAAPRRGAPPRVRRAGERREHHRAAAGHARRRGPRTLAEPRRRLAHAAPACAVGPASPQCAPT
jgi:septal ring factor EnvC (AmiA/AmiB activator)